MEQRICIKFCYKNGIKCSTVLEMLNVAFGESAMSKASAYKWYKRFQEGREDVDDDERLGRPNSSTTDENVNKVKQSIIDNRQLTIRDIASTIGISFGSCQSIISNDLGMRRIEAKFVPKLLTFDQKQHRISHAQEMLNDISGDPGLLKRIITGDEIWIYGYYDDEHDEPTPKKPRQKSPLTNAKVLLTVFFDCNGIVYYEFLPKDRTATKDYYLEVLCRLREAIQRKRIDLWNNNSWQLHYDCTLAHTSTLVREYLAKNNIVIMPQPPYSPDMAPCDFFLFPNIQKTIKGQRFANIESVKMDALNALNGITKNEFQKCFKDWKKRWQKCIVSDGDYFERNENDGDE